MAKIFISYARKDKDEVYPIVKMLESNGLDCWIDKEGIESGDKFKQVIITNINECEVFIYMLSKNAINSEWVGKEYGHAKRKEKRIIPVFLKGAADNDDILFDWGEIDYVDTCSKGWEDKILRDLKAWAVGKSSQSEGTPLKPDFTNEETTFDVRLKSPGASKMAVTKIIYDLLGYNIKTAQELVERTPTILKDCMNRKESDVLKTLLEDAGAEVEITPHISCIESPSTDLSIEQDLYDVILKSTGNMEKIQLVNLIHDLTGHDLARSKQLLDAIPTVIKESISSYEARKLKERFEAAGALTEIKKHDYQEESYYNDYYIGKISEIQNHDWKGDYAIVRNLKRPIKRGDTIYIAHHDRLGIEEIKTKVIDMIDLSTGLYITQCSINDSVGIRFNESDRERICGRYVYSQSFKDKVFPIFPLSSITELFDLTKRFSKTSKPFDNKRKQS